MKFMAMHSIYSVGANICENLDCGVILFSVCSEKEAGIHGKVCLIE